MNFNKNILFPVIIFIFIGLLSVSCGKKEYQQNETEKEKIEQKNESVLKNQQTDGSQKNSEGTETQKEQGNKNYNAKDNIEKISPSQASEYIGKYVTVYGFVADVAVREKVAYLNFDKKYPENPFTGTIFASDFNKFENIEDFKNKYIEVKGKISEYRGKPQIIINNPEQVKIIR